MCILIKWGAWLREKGEEPLFRKVAVYYSAEHCGKTVAQRRTVKQKKKKKYVPQWSLCG